MSRNMRLASKIALGCVLLVTVCVQHAYGDDTLDRLKQKYPFGSLYLTYIPLNDMTNVLNDAAKFRELAKKPPPKEEVLKVFRAFLNAKRERNIADAVAFLQLDLNSTKAGYKKLSDSDGVILPVSWSSEEVAGIALFCDAFLNRLLVYHGTIKAIYDGKLDVATAWSRVGKLKADPYISAERTVPLLTEFNALIERKPKEMEELKRKDPKTHQAIELFKLDLDDYLKDKTARLKNGRGELGDRSAIVDKLYDLTKEEKSESEKILDIYNKSQGKPPDESKMEKQPLRQLIEPTGQSKKKEERPGKLPER